VGRSKGLSARLTAAGPDTPRSPRRRIITYALLIAGSLLLLAMSTSAQVQDVRRGVKFAISPVEEFLAGGARAVNSMLAAFTEVDQLRRENRTLAAQVESLSTQVQQLEVLRSENERLAQLLGTRQSLKFDTVAAFIVNRTPSQLERTATLDRGADAGIEVGDAVLAPGGALAGTITEVFDGSASVRLLNDPRSLAIGITTGTRATGEVIGNFSAPLRLEGVVKTDTLNENDTVTTAGTLVSGAKGLLPRDILIGRIVEVINDPAQFVQTALIQPAADLDRLEAVLVITSYDAPRLPDPDATPAPEPEPQPEASQAPREQPERTQRPGRRPPRP
jgi:rod shape-determining protein MreC